MKTPAIFLLSAVLTLSTSAFAQPAPHNSDTATQSTSKYDRQAQKQQEKYAKQQLKASKREEKAMAASENRVGITHFAH